jgi:hypothetical protein
MAILKFEEAELSLGIVSVKVQFPNPDLSSIKGRTTESDMFEIGHEGENYTLLQMP